MALEVYIDWENVWHEHVRRSLPGLQVARRGDPRGQVFDKIPMPGRSGAVVASTGLTAESISDLAKFPSTLISTLTTQLGRKPDVIAATAIWDQLAYSHICGIPNELKKLGVEVLSPDVSGAKKNELKNASDYYLTLDMWLRHAKRLRSQSDSLDHLYIFSGDHIFAQLDSVCADSPDFELGLLSFSGNVSGALRRKIKSDCFSLGQHYIDHAPAYLDLRRSTLKHCALHKQKMLRPPSYHERLHATCVKRLSETNKAFIPLTLFRDWVKRWLADWESKGLKFNVSVDHCINYLTRAGIIKISEDRSRNVTLSEEKSTHTQALLTFIDINRYGFEHFYDVPPPFGGTRKSSK